MSVDVLREVFHHSTAKATDRCILVALADAAHSDGVTWLPLLPPKPRRGERPRADPRCLTHRANCSRSEAIRAIQALGEKGELEVRKAQRGQRRISVYRVTVGAIAGVEVDYDRLPFMLDQQFVRGLKLRPRNEGLQEGDEVSDPGGTGSQPGTPRGRDLRPRGVSSSRGRVTDPVEPSMDPSFNPSSEPTAATRAGAARAAAAEQLDQELEKLGLGVEIRLAAIADVPRARAWLKLAVAEADSNPAGFFRSGFDGGQWPSERKGAGDRGFSQRRWVEETSWQLDPDDAHTIVDDFRDIDPVERAALHELVDQARANHDQLAARRAAAESAPALRRIA